MSDDLHLLITFVSSENGAAGLVKAAVTIEHGMNRLPGDIVQCFAEPDNDAAIKKLLPGHLAELPIVAVEEIDYVLEAKS